MAEWLTLNALRRLLAIKEYLLANNVTQEIIGIKRFR